VIQHFRSTAFLNICVNGFVRLRQKGQPYTDPNKDGRRFSRFKAKYVGDGFKIDDDRIKIGVQVIALSGGKFQAVAYVGGLPGDGWDKETTHKADGELKDGAVVFAQGGRKGYGERRCDYRG